MSLAADDPRRVRVDNYRFACPLCAYPLTPVADSGSLDRRLSCGRCGLVVKLPYVAASKAVQWAVRVGAGRRA